MCPRYPREKWPGRTDGTSDYGKGPSDEAFSASPPCPLARDSRFGRVSLQSDSPLRHWVEKPLRGLPRLCDDHGRDDRTAQTHPTSPKGIWLPLLRVNQVIGRPRLPQEAHEAPAQSAYRISHRLRVNKHLPGVDSAQEEGHLGEGRHFRRGRGLRRKAATIHDGAH